VALRVFNTMSGRKEEFVPIHGNRVQMFVCGPTVYDYSHLGHARTYVAYDVIAKYLRYRGYSVFYIMNITDLDDKIIRRARELGKGPLEVARGFEVEFYRDMASLGVDAVNLYARATEHIDEMIEQIEGLLEKGYAYVTETGVYYDVTKFPRYGRLSHQNPEELVVHRIEVDPTKRNPGDFALWKRSKEGEPSWDSPFGPGRPGWHIEDTAITLTYFGPQYDIHGGAIELIFPHHEAEIAQAEAYTGVSPLVKYWVHTGILYVNGEKMSKSLGNFITIRDSMKRYDKNTHRMFFVSTLYRSPMDYTDEAMREAKAKVDGIKNSYFALKSLRAGSGGRELLAALDRAREGFLKSMDDDFNTPKALSHLFGLTREINRYCSKHEEVEEGIRERVLSTLEEFLSILGIEFGERVDERLLEGLLRLLIDVREGLRREKRYEEADEIRRRLKELGIILEDTSRGTVWKVEG